MTSLIWIIQQFSLLSRTQCLMERLWTEGDLCASSSEESALELGWPL